MVRKRAPGGGRKPKGEITGKTEAFTTRITSATRHALEDAALKHGRSLSQEAEVALRSYLEKPSGQPRNRALAYIVGNLAEGIEAYTGKNWRTDPFTGTALLRAVEAVMAYLAPEAGMYPIIPEQLEARLQKMPDDVAVQYRRPDAFGAQRAFHLITEIESAPRADRMGDEMDLPIAVNASFEMLGVLAADLDLGKPKD